MADKPVDDVAALVTEPLPPADYSSYSMVRLEVVKGPDTGVILTPHKARLHIGTHASTDLQLSDSNVSRFHCALDLADSVLTVSDLGSKNGTRVNEVLVSEAQLGRSAFLQIGRSVVKVERLEERATIPLCRNPSFGAMRGQSKAMRILFAEMERLAASDMSVLVMGETGTGKDLVAQSLHFEGARAAHEFVVVDCGAISPNLIESELFGHVRGAFTGADSARKGAFENAHKGTLFLDEIGELPLELQPKLLRALEAGEVRPVGSSKSVAVDVRVIAATNRNLRTEINEKRFRSDLFFRIAVAEVFLPPLRKRAEDIETLARGLLSGMGAEGSPLSSVLFSEEGIVKMQRHSWPGNIRELRNYVERCVSFGDAQPLAARMGRGQWSSPVDFNLPFQDARDEVMRDFERAYLSGAIEAAGGNVSEAAQRVGLNRAYFYRILQRCGLR